MMEHTQKKSADELLNRIHLKLNIIMALVLVSTALANPTFTELVKHALK